MLRPFGGPVVYRKSDAIIDVFAQRMNVAASISGRQNFGADNELLEGP
jgi:hypothetical protein